MKTITKKIVSLGLALFMMLGLVMVSGKEVKAAPADSLERMDISVTSILDTGVIKNSTEPGRYKYANYAGKLTYYFNSGAIASFETGLENGNYDFLVVLDTKDNSLEILATETFTYDEIGEGGYSGTLTAPDFLGPDSHQINITIRNGVIGQTQAHYDNDAKCLTAIITRDVTAEQLADWGIPIPDWNKAATKTWSGGNAGLEFVSQIRFDLFGDGGRVYVDGNVVDPANYDAKEGSTIITLKPGFLATLSQGVHTFEIKIADSAIAFQDTFTINTVSPAPAGAAPTSPKTGDSSNAVIILFMMISLMGILARRNRA